MNKNLLTILCILLFAFSAFAQNINSETYVKKEILESFEKKYGISFNVVVVSPRKKIKKAPQVIHKFMPQLNNQIYAFFLKDEVSQKIFFSGLDLAANLKDKFPPKVIVYLASKLLNESLLNGNSIDKSVANMLGALDKALNTTWRSALENYSSAYSDRYIYKRDYAGFSMNYYEFIPFQDTKYDTLEIEKTKLVTNDFIVKKDENEYHILPDDFRSKLHRDWSGSGQLYRYKRLRVIKEMIEGFKKYNAINIVSNWKVMPGTGWEFDVMGLDYKDKNDTTDHLYMELHSLKKGDWMPHMAWTQNYFGWSDNGIRLFWKATRCNIFVGDFSKEYLKLSTTPWGSTGWNADKIHKSLPNMDDFILLEWNEVWEYTNLGFPVFITTPSTGQAGHIAIAYPTTIKIADIQSAYSNGKIVQAGSTNGVKNINEVWSEMALKNQATSYVYVGHLLQ